LKKTTHLMAATGVFIMLLVMAVSVYAQECTPGFSVGTDKGEYLQGEQVTISGGFFDDDCNPIMVPDGIGVQVNLPTGTPFKPWQGGTGSDGIFGFSFMLPEDAMLGTWEVYAAYRGESASSDFLVTTPPEPPPEEPEEEEEDTGGGGGGTCLPKYSCTEWGECQPDGTQTRTCTRVPGCGTSATAPAETQECEYAAGAPETCEEDWVCGAWSECLDSQQTRSCSDMNECGTEEDKPSEAQACEVIEGGGEETQEEGFSITGLFLNPAVGYGLAILVIITLILAGVWKARKP
jgi:hypothetical protein